jgi:hypothetical protein
MNGIFPPRVESDGRRVVSLQLARERAGQFQSRGLMLPRRVSKPDATMTDNRDRRGLLARLEAENAQLRERAVELALENQALRDARQR